MITLNKLFENWRGYLDEDKIPAIKYTDVVFQIIGLLYFHSKDKDANSKIKKIVYWFENRTGKKPDGAMDLLKKAEDMVEKAKPDSRSAMLTLGKKWKVERYEGESRRRIQRSDGTGTVETTPFIKFEWELR